MDEDRLISCVQRFPVLYDSTRPDYIDQLKKKEVWDEIGKELGCSALQCKSRWNSLRDGYRRSVVKNKRRARCGQTAQPYKFSKKLTFVKKFFRPGHDFNSDEDFEHDSDDESDAAISNAGSTHDVSEPPLKKKRRVKIEAYENPGPPDIFEEYLSENNPDIHEDPIQYPTQQKVYPMDLFLSCIGATLKSLPLYYQTLAKADIFAAVHKYELRALTDETAQVHGGKKGGGVPLISASYTEGSST